MTGQGRNQTAIVLVFGAVLLLLLILFVAMALNDQKGRLKQLGADVQAALNPPASPPISAPTGRTSPPSTPLPERQFPLAGGDSADRLAPTAEPIGNPAHWFSNDDYPIEARRRNEEGRVMLQLTIDTHGKADACAIVSSSGSIFLDDATCDLAMRRSRFVPARGADGKAVGSSWTGAIRWQLTDE
jgi:protein TonB